MDATEKYFTLLDAIDRMDSCEELEGAINLNELMRRPAASRFGARETLEKKKKISFCVEGKEGSFLFGPSSDSDDDFTIEVDCLLGASRSVLFVLLTLWFSLPSFYSFCFLNLVCFVSSIEIQTTNLFVLN